MRTGIRAAGPPDITGIKRLYKSLQLDLGVTLDNVSDDDLLSPLQRIFVIEREAQVRAWSAVQTGTTMRSRGRPQEMWVCKDTLRPHVHCFMERGCWAVLASSRLATATVVLRLWKIC